ncbi:MAG: 30S ribosomal protein S12 methylthiotransferase RimO, partial [Verrucomicrobiota bacterium]
MKSPAPIKIGLVSLGCAKNLVDSEVMLGTLARAGMTLTERAEEADVLIVNTCGFINKAKQESIDTILKLNQLRETGNCKALIMAGCLTQRYPQELRRDLPEVDAIIGLNEVPRIAEIVLEILEKRAPAVYWSGPAKYVPDFSAPRVRLTPKHTAYVKIAEGCNHPCAFCSIPRIRGKYRSRPVADVIAEIRALVADGCKEINLISQDTTFYGRDLNGGQELLCKLLRQAQAIPGDFWIRLLYTHPAHWTDELIATIAGCDKICRYVDMPLQHINDAMLTAMKRETSGKFIRDLIGRIRTGVPGIVLRTAFIVGFPGETEAQFEELLEFIAVTKFERLGVFAYSQEDHTAAGNLAQ